ncbi:MAG: hypothetical protein ABEJ03_04185 [Candidatus Nanohaloarchaea archaeon]
MVEEERIREVSEDRARAEDLSFRSRRRFKIQKDREVSDFNSFEILESVYEAIRESIEASMAAEGWKSEDHVAAISYADEKLGVSDATLNNLHRFRKPRNRSRYEACEITQKEAEQILDVADSLIHDLPEKAEGNLR